MTKKDDSFRSLYEKYQLAVVAFLMRFGFDRETAQDLAQDTFVRVYEHMDSWRREAEWNFVRKTALRIALNELRSRQAAKRKGRAVPIDAPSAPQLPSPDAPMDELLVEKETEELHRTRFNSALASLPERLRGPLVLRLSGSKYKEIASALAISLDTVKTRIHEAKTKLRELLGISPGELDDHEDE